MATPGEKLAESLEVLHRLQVKSGIVDQNSIQKSGNPQDNSWGIKVYRSKVDIILNEL